MIVADIAWQTAAAVAVGLAITGLILWLGLRNRTADIPTDTPPPKLLSRVVSWTSMIHRGSYRDETKSLRPTRGSVEVLIATSARPDNPVMSRVLEKSIHSLTLVAEEPVDPGTVAKVRPLNAPDTIPWVEINVNECNQEANEWRIACRFVKVPPYSVLMLFG